MPLPGRRGVQEELCAGVQATGIALTVRQDWKAQVHQQGLISH